MGKKLLVGVLIDSYLIPNWAYTMVERIVGSDYAEIGLLIEKESSGLTEKIQYANMGDRFEMFLFSAYCKLDSFFNKLEPDAFETKDLHLLTPDIPSITITPISREFLACINETDCEKIRAYQVDVLISLGVGTFSGQVLACAKYGIWSYQHGDNGGDNGELAGFWDVFEGRGETGSVLQILTGESGQELVLCRSFGQTDSLSVARNNNNHYWKTASFIPRKLRELHTLGEEAFFSNVRQDNQHPVFYSKKKYTVPKKSEWIGLLLQHSKKLLYHRVQSFFYFNQYILLYDLNECGMYSSTLSKYKKLIPPPDRFWADPFVIYENHKYYVFIEEVPAQSNRGHISCFTIDETGTPSAPKKIIDNPYHMSYPFVFSHNNAYYMIAETGENKTIDLYRCIDFPEKWEKLLTLMENIQAFDTTVFLKDGKWWLFVNIKENEGVSSSDELFLFYSEDIISGNWTAHAKNPIVSDVKSARPAGKIFAYNGNIYRPSQNSSKIYGYGMKLNHIVTLSETDYKEECVSEIEPLWDKSIIAVHTLNFVNGLTIIDGLTQRPRYPAAIYRRLRRSLNFFR
jgi:hypothetical protein